MFTTDKIAVLMAIYNGENYIEEQLQSIIAQTETNWELFIHDDGSTDGSLQIVNRYKTRDPNRIHIMEGPSCGGAKDNFFFLMRQIDAPYMMFCDQDDVWLPEKIELTFQRMREQESRFGEDTPLMVFSDLTVVDHKLHRIAERISVYQKLDPRRVRCKDLMIQNVITGCTVMVNRALMKKAICMERTDEIIMHDWWCALIAAQFGNISYVDLPLVLYRQHGDNSVGAKNVNSLKYLGARLRNKRSVKQSLAATQNQMRYFAETYSISDPVLCRYGQLGGMNKAKRLWFYATNGVHKCGWQRNLGLLIWG